MPNTYVEWKDGEDEFSAEADVKLTRYEHGADADGNRGEMRWDAEIDEITVWKNGEELVKADDNQMVFAAADEKLQQKAFDDERR